MFTLAREGWPFIIGTPLLVLLTTALLVGLGGAWALWPGVILAAIALAFMVYFFRDPARQAPDEPGLVVSGADGKVRSIEVLEDSDLFGGKPALRISVYLSPMDVHVNRCPIGGKVAATEYIPGKHLLTMSNASSEWNEHSVIRLDGEGTTCVVHQIVGPLVRRVIYWLNEGQTIVRGERLGLMKFGSRLDLYLPAEEFDVLVEEGQKVQAALSPVARRRPSS